VFRCFTLFFILLCMLATVGRAEPNAKYLECPKGTQAAEESIDPSTSPRKMPGNIGGFDKLIKCQYKASDNSLFSMGEIYYSSDFSNKNVYIDQMTPLKESLLKKDFIQDYYADVKRNCMGTDCASFPNLPELLQGGYSTNVWIKNDQVYEMEFVPNPSGADPSTQLNKNITINDEPENGTKSTVTLDMCMNVAGLVQYNKNEGVIAETRIQGTQPLSSLKELSDLCKVDSKFAGLGLKPINPQTITTSCRTPSSNNVLTGIFELRPVISYRIGVSKSSRSSSELRYEVSFSLILNNKVLIHNKILTRDHTTNIELGDYLKAIHPHFLKTEKDRAIDAALDCFDHITWSSNTPVRDEQKSEDFYDPKVIVEQIQSLNVEKINEHVPSAHSFIKETKKR
jgi:hypothetical protein